MKSAVSAAILLALTTSPLAYAGDTFRCTGQPGPNAGAKLVLTLGDGEYQLSGHSAEGEGWPGPVTCTGRFESEDARSHLDNYTANMNPGCPATSAKIAPTLALKGKGTLALVRRTGIDRPGVPGMSYRYYRCAK